jgi:saccharopine dehydrogenase (NAD+, L-lysine-forming)
MEACLACKVNYMDTANYEPEKPTIGWRAVYEKRCARRAFRLLRLLLAVGVPREIQEAGITALMGAFRPGRGGLFRLRTEALF